MVDKSKFWMTADFETITPDWRKILKKKGNQRVSQTEINHYYETEKNPIVPEVYLWSVVVSIDRLKNVFFPTDLDIDVKLTEKHIIIKGVTIQSFLLFFKQQIYSWFVYFHNLKGFDGHYILPALEKLGIAKQQSELDISERNELQAGEFKSMVEKNKMIYQIDWRIDDSGGKDLKRTIARHIKFCDNLLMFTTSVEEMGRQLASHYIKLGMDKKEAELKYHKQSIEYIRHYGYDNVEQAKKDKKVFDYVEQDSLIVFEFRKMMMDLIDPIFPAKNWGMTAGSTAVRHWKQLYGNKLISEHAQEIVTFKQTNGGYLYTYKKSRKKMGILALRNKLVREVLPTKWLDDDIEGLPHWVDIYKYYNGGITKINEAYRGILTNSVWVIDIVSSYPTIMNSDLPCPVGKPTDDGNFVLYEILLLNDVENKDGLPFIPVNNGESKEWRSKLTKGQIIPLSSATIQHFMDHYNVKKEDIHIRVNYKFNTKKFKDIFGDYIEMWYKVKDYAKRDGNDFLKQFAKIMLNALYGKFGTKRDHTGYYFNKKNTQFIEMVEVLDSKFYLPIAIAITDYARMRLVEAVGNDYKDNLYEDTDSLFITDELYKKIVKEKRLPIGKQLGDWELENQHPYKFFGRRPKQYLAECEIGGQKCKECKKPRKIAFAGINFLQTEQIWSDDHEWTDSEIKFRDSIKFRDYMYGKKINNQIQPMIITGYGKILYEQVKEIKPIWDSSYKKQQEQIYFTKKQWINHPNNASII